MELLGVGLVVDQRVLEERERGAVGRREPPEEIVAPRQELLEDVERARELSPELGNPSLIRTRAFARSASISFGGRFQTRLNQSRKTSSSA